MATPGHIKTARTVLSVIAMCAACHPRAGVLPQQPDAADGEFLRNSAVTTSPALLRPELMDTFGIRRTPVFSGDGRQMFWATDRGAFHSVLMTARLEHGEWTRPQPLPFSDGGYFDHNPAVTRDGRTLVFATNRPIAAKPATTIAGTPVPTSDLWMTTLTSNGWTQPRPLPAAFNTTFDDDCPVLAADGTLYFSSARPGAPGPGAIYMARREGGAWLDPEMLAVVNSAAGEMVTGIAPDRSYLLFYSMRPGAEAGLYVSFRGEADTWRPPQRLPESVNALRAYAANVTPDGAVLLFTAPVEKMPRIYAVDARAVLALRRSEDAGDLEEQRVPLL